MCPDPRNQYSGHAGDRVEPRPSLPLAALQRSYQSVPGQVGAPARVRAPVSKLSGQDERTDEQDAVRTETGRGCENTRPSVGVLEKEVTCAFSLLISLSACKPFSMSALVHEEAERLEHFISERFEERIASKLGHPTFDPHGHYIPAMNGQMPKQTSKPLTDILGEGVFIVDSVSDQDALLLKRLRAHGVTPGARLMVTSRSKDAFVLRAGNASKALRLSRALAGTVRIRSVH